MPVLVKPNNDQYNLYMRKVLDSFYVMSYKKEYDITTDYEI